MDMRTFCEKLSEVNGPQTLTLTPGPAVFRVGKQDGMAARLLLWLVANLPADATQGDLDDVLDAAKWWSTFWASLPEDAAPPPVRFSAPPIPWPSSLNH